MQDDIVYLYKHDNNEQRDGFEYLKRDHVRIRAAFDAFRDAKTFEQKKLVVKNRLIKILSQHESLEERYVTPLYRAHLDHGNIIADKILVDDQLGKEIMRFVMILIHNSSFLETCNPDEDPRIFELMVNRLRDLELDHLKFEEEEIFGVMQKKLDVKSLQELEDTLANAHASAPTHPHPQAPNKGIAAKVTHSIAGLVDSLSDKWSTS